VPPSERSRRIRRILVIHGPNLNLLGKREPKIYGRRSLSQINQMIGKEAESLGIGVDIAQSNSEGEIVDLIQRSPGRFSVIIINPAGYTHTSVAIPDAIASAGVPAIEVHLTNIYGRESFRRRSYVAPVSRGQISGFGPEGYLLALRAACLMLDAGRKIGRAARKAR
jgi:3-dehydroquinate dehydratase II